MKRISQFLFMSLFVALFFQNCSGKNFQGLEDLNLERKGNGESYTGKIYHYRLPDSQICGDQSNISSSILATETSKFYLIRDACVDLAQPEEILGAELTLIPDANALVYKQERFVSETLPTASGAMPRVAAKTTYEVYPNRTCGGYADYQAAPAIVSGGQCAAFGRVATTASRATVNSGNKYQFSMYNASSQTHSVSFRQITYQSIEVSARHNPNSVDLVLYSYEPVRWVIRGNTAAVRSVHVSGYHCAVVAGVPARLVSISTTEQGASANAATLQISNRLAKNEQVYDGSCKPDRTFVAD